MTDSQADLGNHVLHQRFLQLVLLDRWHANAVALINETQRNRNCEPWVLDDLVQVKHF